MDFAPRRPEPPRERIVAEEDQRCAVYGCRNPAVLDGLAYQPCYEHWREGYRLSVPRGRRTR